MEYSGTLSLHQMNLMLWRIYICHLHVSLIVPISHFWCRVTPIPRTVLVPSRRQRTSLSVGDSSTAIIQTPEIYIFASFSAAVFLLSLVFFLSFQYTGVHCGRLPSGTFRVGLSYANIFSSYYTPNAIQDFDEGLVGQTVTRGLTTSTSSSITWTAVNTSQFSGDPSQVGDAVIQEKTWVAVTSMILSFRLHFFNG